MDDKFLSLKIKELYPEATNDEVDNHVALCYKFLDIVEQLNKNKKFLFNQQEINSLFLANRIVAMFVKDNAVISEQKEKDAYEMFLEENNLKKVKEEDIKDTVFGKYCLRSLGKFFQDITLNERIKYIESSYMFFNIVASITSNGMTSISPNHLERMFGVTNTLVSFFAEKAKETRIEEKNNEFTYEKYCKNSISLMFPRSQNNEIEELFKCCESIFMKIYNSITNKKELIKTNKNKLNIISFLFVAIEKFCDEYYLYDVSKITNKQINDLFVDCCKNALRENGCKEKDEKNMIHNCKKLFFTIIEIAKQTNACSDCLIKRTYAIICAINNGIVGVIQAEMQSKE